jgi:hypothetical protein
MRATHAHIRVAVIHANAAKRAVNSKPDGWFRDSLVLMQWRAKVKASSVHQLAREYLAFWRRQTQLGMAHQPDWRSFELPITKK